MKARLTTLIHRSVSSMLKLALLAGVATAVPLFAGDGKSGNYYEHGKHEHAAPAKLVQIVRDATQQITSRCLAV
jgi:hypothetical protein